MATHSDCMAMESKIRQVEREIRQLEQEHNLLCNAISGARNAVGGADSIVKQNANGGASLLGASCNTLEAAAATQTEIERLNKLYKNIETAYKTIRARNLDLRYKQSNYRLVTKVMLGMMDNISSGIISDENIEKTASKAHLQTQDYYLSYIMMSIVHWKNGDKTKADFCMDKALELNLKASATVYFIFNIKTLRFDVAASWLNLIIDQGILDSDKEFFKVNLLYYLNLSDGQSFAKLKKACERYINLSYDLSDRKVRKAIFEEIYETYHSLVGADVQEFPLINKYVKQKNIFVRVLTLAMSNNKLHGYIKGLIEPIEGRTHVHFFDLFMEKYLADARTPALEEIHDAIRYNEEIIRHGGDIGAATASKAAQDIQASMPLNALVSIYSNIGSAEKFKGKDGLRLFGYRNFKKEYKKAYKQYVTDYTCLVPESYDVQIDGCAWKTDLKDSDRDKTAIDSHFGALRDADIKKAVKIAPIIVFSILGAAAIAGIFLLLDMFSNIGSYACMAFTAISALIVALTPVKNSRKKKAITERYAKRAEDVLLESKRIKSEIDRFREVFEEYHGDSKKVFEYLDLP